MKNVNFLLLTIDKSANVSCSEQDLNVNAPPPENPLEILPNISSNPSPLDQIGLDEGSVNCKNAEDSSANEKINSQCNELSVTLESCIVLDTHSYEFIDTNKDDSTNTVLNLTEEDLLPVEDKIKVPDDFDKGNKYFFKSIM